MTFEDMVAQATMNQITPYHYQRRMADEGLPELLEVPTGAGKTMAAVLPWLYRRRLHSDDAVRAETPRWLVFALPMRVLVDQTMATISAWLTNLGVADEVGLHVLMGGENLSRDDWRLHPEQDAVFVGTIDMLLSRALNRGYGESRWCWPIDFGLFNNDCQWVFDEVQLLGPALPTSRQLEGLRAQLGLASQTCTMWMSATVDQDALRTVDAPDIATHLVLADDDLVGPLADRVRAPKVLSELTRASDGSLASAVVREHRRGTRTIVVCNTVERATDTYRAVVGATDAEVVLVHSRFRPRERSAAVERATAAVDTGSAGTIVVSTQVLEAGVDISSSTLITESAPWASVVQRAGRCNRYGEEPQARVIWVEVPKPEPYEADEVKLAVEALRDLEGTVVTARSLPLVEVNAPQPIHAVLRRRDLVELFDTTPDLTGNDIDVSRFIRASEDLDVDVAWRDERPASRRDRPSREERCKVSIGSIKKAIDKRSAWKLDPIAGEWRSCGKTDVRPGDSIVLAAGEGGYSIEWGWDPKLKTAVPVVEAMAPDEPLAELDVAVADDPMSLGATEWLGLTRHLADVEHEVEVLLSAMAPRGLGPTLGGAAVSAGRLHDIGKAHEWFQQMLGSCADGEKEVAARDATDQPWAKSGGTGRPLRPADDRHRRYFRHELASALALLGEGSVALDDVAERDLVVYLVAAHHGRIRLGFRPLPDERPDPARPHATVALGVVDGDRLPEVALPSGAVPTSTLRLEVMGLGSSDGGEPSWTARAIALRDRSDLGPFRLAYLEAIVRLADWRASSGLFLGKDVQ